MSEGNARRSPSWRTWVGLLLLVFLVAGTLTWTFWNPAVDHGTAKAAIVDLDDPVTVEGKTIPLGRELADKLVNGSDRRYAWEVTDASDAEDGLRSGRYAAVVTVPADFSKTATSFITGSAEDATQAVLSIRTSAAARPADPGLSHAVVQNALASLNTTVVETYLDGIYVSFTEMHDKLGEAADGAKELAKGSKQLKNGAKRLDSGATRLARGAEDLDAGAGRLSEGADSLATGLGSLTEGAEQVDAGTERLDEGARTLAAGAGRLAIGTDRLAAGSTRLLTGVDDLSMSLSLAEGRTAGLPGLLERLAAGARGAARGDTALAGRMIPVANRVLRTVDGIPSRPGLSRDLHRLATRCSPRKGEFCGSLGNLSHRLAARGRTADAFKGRVRARTVKLRRELRALKRGAGRRASVLALARGLDQAATGGRRLDTGLARLRSDTDALARGANRLESGTATLSADMSRLSSGAGRVAEGSREALAGSRRLASGAKSLQDGAGTLAEGSRSLASGSETLAKGAGRLETGANELSKGLTEARDEVPSYTEAERNHLKTVAATPMKSRWTGRVGFGRAATVLFLVLALWTGALGASLLLRALPPGLLTSRSPTRRLLYRTLVPAAPAAAVTGLVLGAALGPVLGLDPARWAALAATSALIALTFTLVCQALAAALGGLGLLLAATVLVLALAADVLSSIPGAVASLSTLPPTYGALLATRALILDTEGLPNGLLHLLTWLLLALAVLAFMVVRRRSLRPGDLRFAK